MRSLRMEVDLAKPSERGLKKGEVVESGPIVTGELTNGNCHAPDGAGDEEKKRPVLMLREVNDIVNRGGRAEERILELRGRLGEEGKSLAAAAE